MNYIKYEDYTGQTLQADEQILMSGEQFVNGGKYLRDVPLTITPDGSEPIEVEE